MCSSPPLYLFEDVSVQRNGIELLASVDVVIPSKGVTAVLGPSGAGKSTLLRLCNRLEVPDRGRVCFGHDDVADLDPLELRRRVGMVFQRPTLFAGTVRDNLLEARPTATARELEEVLALVELHVSFLERPREQLSGGEAQRACLARTLITRPEVLLLDEPTAAVDPDRRLAIEDRVRELAEAGTPVLWVTHDLEQARRVGDRRVVLIGGRLASEPEVAEYLHDDTTEEADP